VEIAVAQYGSLVVSDDGGDCTWLLRYR
jgi:hypothetical protein